MTEETSKISDEEFQALQGTLNNDHLTKIVNGNPALVVKHDLIGKTENLEIDEQVLKEINSKSIPTNQTLVATRFIQGLLHPVAIFEPQEFGTLRQSKGPASWDRAI